MNSFFVTGADVHRLDAAAAEMTEHVHGQLFNRHDPDVMNSLFTRKLLIRVDEDPIDFLDRLPEGGIVLPYEHARCVAWSCVWGYLRKNLWRAVIVQCDPLQTILKYRPKVSYVDPKELERVAASHDHITRELVKYFRHNPRIEPPQQESFDPRPRVENWNEIKDIYESMRSIPRQ
jgi:hypothetical protein